MFVTQTYTQESLTHVDYIDHADPASTEQLQQSGCQSQNESYLTITASLAFREQTSLHANICEDFGQIDGRKLNDASINATSNSRTLGLRDEMCFAF